MSIRDTFLLGGAAAHPADHEVQIDYRALGEQWTKYKYYNDLANDPNVMYLGKRALSNHEEDSFVVFCPLHG